VKIEIIEEAGYSSAMLGLSLSYGTTIEKAQETAVKLADKDGGHNKFLESINIWLDITAPRFWWQEADTYRVGCTKQSESTIHTIAKRPLRQRNFEGYVDDDYIAYLNTLRAERKGDPIKTRDSLLHLKNALPEGFLQRRIWAMNYKCLRNIMLQREKHVLPQWQKFCKYMKSHVEYPELLGLTK